MKATGIVRRIDDLGRVVVPKEIRKVLRIREGDPEDLSYFLGHDNSAQVVYSSHYSRCFHPFSSGVDFLMIVLFVKNTQIYPVVSALIRIFIR